AQRDLAGAILWAEKHPAKNHGSAMDRTHMQVLAMRGAEQQRMIAKSVKVSKLSTEQAATLEKAQAEVADAGAKAGTDGHETVEEARAIQGSQDLQDYSIKQDPNVATQVAEAEKL